MVTASIGCVAKGCGIAEEEIRLLGNGVCTWWLLTSRVTLLVIQFVPLVFMLTTASLDEEHLWLVDKGGTHQLGQGEE